MKNLIVVSLLVAFVAISWARPEEEKYTDEFDDLDEDAILASPRLVKNYINCAKTGEKCTPDGKKFREIIPDALKTKCAKCTETQRRKSRKILKWIVTNEPEAFLDIEDIFDAKHEYRQAYTDELEKDGIVLPPLRS